jgi:hypothetical protein
MVFIYYALAGLECCTMLVNRTLSCFKVFDPFRANRKAVFIIIVAFMVENTV